jgi:hypothetical protein
VIVGSAPGLVYGEIGLGWRHPGVAGHELVQDFAGTVAVLAGRVDVSLLPQLRNLRRLLPDQRVTRILRRQRSVTARDHPRIPACLPTRHPIAAEP